MPTDLASLTDQDKDAIIRQAIQVCRWVGWMRAGVVPGLLQFEKLKAEIEERLGLEIEEYN